MNIKSKYKICIIALIAEFIVIFFLHKAEVQIRSLFVNAIGALLCLLPIFILLVLMSKDNAISIKKRMLFKAIYVFIIFCYVGGIVAQL